MSDITFDFSGRVAIVTGAGSGIGKAIAVELAASGAGVVVGDLKQEVADKVAAALRQLRVDLGGYLVDFPANGKNVGAEFVDIGVVDSRGKLMY